MTHKRVYRMKLAGNERLVGFLQTFLATYVEKELSLGRARNFKAALKVVFGDAVTVQIASLPIDVKAL